MSLAGTEETLSSEVAETAGAIAQTSSNPTNYTVLHVNAASGHDTQGDGSQLRPYQTVTHALSLADTNTLILLAGGLYSADSGETFPLRLRSGVTVQGMAGPNAANVLIQGNGNYRSTSSGLRQVTMLGADNAGLANITISNPHPEGTGLWVESGSPIVLNNAFFRNGANGIYIAGQGAPVIRGNYFGENGNAGLVIAGPSTAKVEANVFENTGAGITVAPESSPEIVNNQISGNLDGLIVHGEASPTLRGNEIVRNRRNSIVDYAAWSTVPPSSQRPGATQPPPPAAIAAPQAQASPPPASNVSAVALASPPVPAEGEVPSPAVTPSEAIATSSAIDQIPALSAPATAVPVPVAETSNPTPSELAAASSTTITAPPEAATPPTAESPEIAFNALTEETLGDRLGREINSTAITLNQVDFRAAPAVFSEAALAGLDLLPVVETAQSLAIARAAEFPPDEAPAEGTGVETNADIFSPLPPLGEDVQDESLLSDTSQSPAVIDIPVIPPPVSAIAKPDALPSPSTALPAAIEAGDTLPAVPAVPSNPASTTAIPRLAVPNADIPLGSGGSLPDTLTAGAALPGEGPPPPPSLAASLGLNYKVLVTASDPNIQAEVRAQVPDAFRRRLNGQLYIQAGAYPTLEEAQAMLNQLRQAGLPAQIEEVR